MHSLELKNDVGIILPSWYRLSALSFFFSGLQQALVSLKYLLELHYYYFNHHLYIIILWQATCTACVPRPRIVRPILHAVPRPVSVGLGLPGRTVLPRGRLWQWVQRARRTCETTGKRQLLMATAAVPEQIKPQCKWHSKMDLIILTGLHCSFNEVTYYHFCFYFGSITKED